MASALYREIISIDGISAQMALPEFIDATARHLRSTMVAVPEQMDLPLRSNQLPLVDPDLPRTG